MESGQVVPVEGRLLQPLDGADEEELLGNGGAVRPDDVDLNRALMSPNASVPASRPLGLATTTTLYAAVGPMLSDLFPVEIRYTAVAITYNLAGVVAGFFPLIASSLYVATGHASWSVSTLFCVIALISLTAASGVGRILKRESHAAQAPAAPKADAESVR
jgi:MFS family permease